MKSVLFFGLFFSLSAAAELPTYECHFWQPDQAVKTFAVDNQNRTWEQVLLKPSEYVKVFNTEEQGISIAHFEGNSHDLLAVASGQGGSEVRLSIREPRFSLSCYRK